MTKRRTKSTKHTMPATEPVSPTEYANGVDQAHGELLELLLGTIVTCRAMARAGETACPVNEQEFQDAFRTTANVLGRVLEQVNVMHGNADELWKAVKLARAGGVQ